MKVLLTSLNSKYIHTNLAIRYLNTYCEDIEAVNFSIKEFTINDHIPEILREIFKERPDILCFSCYIWNIEETIKLVQLYKSIAPTTKIILGGPEVTYDAVHWMNKIEEIDFIVKGEGEETYYQLIKHLIKGQEYKDIKGIVYRENPKNIRENPNRELLVLDKIPFPYGKNLSNLENKIIYYESSRGCPFKCQYCLSSTIEGVRYISLDRVKKDLTFFINAGVKQVKFVDRTFNCDRNRTKAIVEFIIGKGGKTNFHFEFAADLIDQELLEIFKSAPIGMFQLEIGIQSTHLPTLKEIQRINNFEKIKKAVHSIKSYNNIHQHVDLIAGLPYEDYNTFKNSFNEVYNLKADMLQLGFLKILRGSAIESNKEKHGYKYSPFPPYEVLSNNYISYEDIVKLKLVEEILERYSNSHIFDYTIDFLIENKYPTPFSFFEHFSQFWEERNLFNISHSQKNLYKIFRDFLIYYHGEDIHILMDLLKFDYLLTHKGPLPDFLEGYSSKRNKKEKIFDFLKEPENIAKYLPEFIGRTSKDIYKHVHFEEFNGRIGNFIGIEGKSNALESFTLVFYFPKQRINIINKAIYKKIIL